MTDVKGIDAWISRGHDRVDDDEPLPARRYVYCRKCDTVDIDMRQTVCRQCGHDDLERETA